MSGEVRVLDDERIPSTRDYRIDAKLERVLDAKGWRGVPVARARRLAIRDVAQAIVHVLDAKDRRIADLERDLAETVKAKGGKSALEAEREVEEAEARYEKLLAAFDAAGESLAAASDLAEHVLKAIGGEDIVNETLEEYRLRRLCEDVSDELGRYAILEGQVER